VALGTGVAEVAEEAEAGQRVGGEQQGRGSSNSYASSSSSSKSCRSSQYKTLCGELLSQA